MNPKSLTVVAHIKAKPGRENQVRQELLSVVAPTRKEAGCLNYDLHQSTENPSHFLFHENWTSKELLDQHLQSPHVQKALANVGDLLAESPQITLWENVS